MLKKSRSTLNSPDWREGSRGHRNEWKKRQVVDKIFENSHLIYYYKMTWKEYTWNMFRRKERESGKLLVDLVILLWYSYVAPQWAHDSEQITTHLFINAIILFRYLNLNILYNDLVKHSEWKSFVIWASCEPVSRATSFF